MISKENTRVLKQDWSKSCVWRRYSFNPVFTSLYTSILVVISTPIRGNRIHEKISRNWLFLHPSNLHSVRVVMWTFAWVPVWRALAIYVLAIPPSASLLLFRQSRLFSLPQLFYSILTVCSQTCTLGHDNSKRKKMLWATDCVVIVGEFG